MDGGEELLDNRELVKMPLEHRDERFTNVEGKTKRNRFAGEISGGDIIQGLFKRKCI